MAEKEPDDDFGRELLALLGKRYDIENASVMLVTNEANAAQQTDKKTVVWSLLNKVFS